MCNPFAHTSARSARSLAGRIPTIRPSSARTQPTCAQRSCSLLCCKGTDSARTHAVFFSTLGERSARRYKCSRSPSTPAHPSPEVGHDSCGGGSSMLCGTFSQHTRRRLEARLAPAQAAQEEPGRMAPQVQQAHVGGACRSALSRVGRCLLAPPLYDASEWRVRPLLSLLIALVRHFGAKER